MAEKIQTPKSTTQKSGSPRKPPKEMEPLKTAFELKDRPFGLRWVHSSGEEEFTQEEVVPFFDGPLKAGIKKAYGGDNGSLVNGRWVLKNKG